MNMMAKVEQEISTRRWSGLVIDPSSAGVVKLLNAGLDDKNGEIVAHGWLTIDSLNLLRVDNYQREVLGKSGNKRTSLQKAVTDGGRLPDIMLGMRGEHIAFPKGSSICSLMDPVYIIDGLQRVFALKHFAEAHPEEAKTIKIGAEVRFGTTRDSEKALFLVLNTARIPMSPNVVLRNLREEHPGVLTLYGLSTSDKNFALYERVCWNQRMTRTELMSATTLARVAKTLHSSGGSSGVEYMAAQLDSVAEEIKLGVYRENVSEFFEIIDGCFGLRSIEVTQKITQLRGNFLITVADVFATHENFWKSNRLYLDQPTKRKLAQFPINDPEIGRLAGAGNSATPILVSYMVDHFNKGKQVKHRLHKRQQED
jgi:hypothetical protein